MCDTCVPGGFFYSPKYTVYFKTIFVVTRKVLESDSSSTISISKYKENMSKSYVQAVKSAGLFAAPMRQVETNTANSTTLDLLV